MRRAEQRVFLLVSTLAIAVPIALGSHVEVAHADDPRTGGARPPVPLDGIVAIVDDVTIFRSDVATRIRHLESNLSRDPRERRLEIVELKRVMVQRLVDETLIAKDAAKLHVVVSEAEVSNGIDKVASANKMDRKQLETEVAKSGYAPAEYQDEIRRQILEQKWLVLRAIGKIDRKKTRDPEAFEAAIEKQRASLLVELRAHAYVEVR